MGQVLHGSATTTAAVRRAIQDSQESLKVLARRHGINAKTVAKWRKRTTTEDRKTGPKTPQSTVLSLEEEAMIVAFRRHTLLPLDDCLHALLPTLPNLTRSSVHRCLQRHGISRLPDAGGDKPAMKTFKRYPIGYLHVDLAEVRTAEGRLYLHAAIDRTSKFAFTQLVDKANRRTATALLAALVDAVPYKIHTILPDNGIRFVLPPRYRDGVSAKYGGGHMFGMRCVEYGIEHRLTKVRHPWSREDKKTVRGTVFPSGGQVERMNRIIKDATVKRFHYDNHDQLRTHLADFMNACNCSIPDDQIDPRRSGLFMARLILREIAGRRQDMLISLHKQATTTPKIRAAI